MTFKYAFDYKEDDVYWCTADVGWITGHSYMVYGPMVNAASQVFFEGVPTYPDVKRIAQVVEKYKVNSLYTAPTAIRALMAHGDVPTEGCDVSSLRLLGTVGEPINPEAWEWYHSVIGMSRCLSSMHGGTKQVDMILPAWAGVKAWLATHISALPRYLMLTVMSGKAAKGILLLKTAGRAKLERFMAIISLYQHLL